MEGINEMLGGTEISNKVTRENLTEWVAFELRPEGSEGASTLTEETANAKALWQE